MADRTALEMLELIVNSAELNLEKAEKTGQAIALAMHPNSILLEEAKRIIKRDRNSAP